MLVLVFCDKDKNVYKMYMQCTQIDGKAFEKAKHQVLWFRYYEDCLWLSIAWAIIFSKISCVSYFLLVFGVFFPIDISFLSFSSFHHFVCSCGKTHCVTSLNVIDLNVLVADDERLIMIADRLFFFLAMFCYWFFISFGLYNIFFRSQSLISPSSHSTIWRLIWIFLGFAFAQVVHSSESILLTPNRMHNNKKFTLIAHKKSMQELPKYIQLTRQPSTVINAIH